MSYVKYLKEELKQQQFKFKFMNISEIPQELKKDGITNPLPIEKWKLKDEPDEYLSAREVKELGGLYDEKRQWRMDKKIGAMFGNYTMEEWYEFVKDIAINGLKNPIFIDKNEYGDLKVSEGNHRVQALRQLGYKKIPVIYSSLAKEKQKI